MTEPIKPTPPQTVKCETCMKEVPVSEAKSAEAEDYVVHFCGLECYEQWIKRRRKTPSASKPGSDQH